MKVLCFVNGHSLAHVTRPLEIAKELKARGHEIIFAGMGQYLKIVEQDHFRTASLPYISTEQMMTAVKNNKLHSLFPLEQLTLFVELERSLIYAENPDLVLVDCRVTAQTSAELCNRPCVSISNTHMTNFRAIPFYSIQNCLPGIPKFILEIANQWENKLELALYHHLVLSSLVELRRKLNLPHHFCHANESGYKILLADIPEFNPAKSNELTQFIGPLPWHNSIPVPLWRNKLDPKTMTIYITLGSEGLFEILNHLNLFADLDMQFIIATGCINSLPIATIPANVYIEPFINADHILPYCDLVICHGGNGTIYQALSYQLPVVGFATHAEQAYGLKRVEALKVGKNLPLNLLKNPVLFKKEILKLSKELINNSNIQSSIESITRTIQTWNAPVNGSTLIENWMESKIC
jgi:UDP:flavonoid glycosyltransferase YjiC (YdhE family)